MAKRVILKLDGILEEGCHVVLEIGSQSDRQVQISGQLPPIQNWHDWQPLIGTNTARSTLQVSASS